MIQPVATQDPARDVVSIAQSQAQAAAFSEKLLPALTKADMRPGNILQTINDNKTWLRVLINNSQRAPNANSGLAAQGDPTRVHTAMWAQTPGNPKRTSQHGPGEPEVVEAFKNKLVQGNALQVDSYDVWEPVDRTLGSFAAQNGMAAVESAIPYSRAGAAGTMVYSAKFSDAAKKMLESYGKDAFEPDQSWAKGGAFCAQFVLTSYQGAHQSMYPGQEPSGVLHTDPRYTSPCLLDHLLKTNPDQFTYRGVLKITPDDVAYRPE